jgi:hypothetical protein
MKTIFLQTVSTSIVVQITAFNKLGTEADLHNEFLKREQARKTSSIFTSNC